MSPAPRTIGVVAAAHRSRALDAAREAIRWLNDHRVRVLLNPETAAALGTPADGDPDIYQAADLIVVLGGDGSIIANGRAAGLAGAAEVEDMRTAGGEAAADEAPLHVRHGSRDFLQRFAPLRLLSVQGWDGTHQAVCIGVQRRLE